MKLALLVLTTLIFSSLAIASNSCPALNGVYSHKEYGRTAELVIYKNKEGIPYLKMTTFNDEAETHYVPLNGNRVLSETTITNTGCVGSDCHTTKYKEPIYLKASCAYNWVVLKILFPKSGKRAVYGYGGNYNADEFIGAYYFNPDSESEPEQFTLYKMM